MSSLLSISGYVLAGGRSSRMGRDKALLALGGKPLIEHAVGKLRRICTEVAILSGNPELAAYAPVVPDLHAGCGPIGGIEAALAHSCRDWNLILPVDLPFVPVALLYRWAAACCADRGGTRLAMFRVGERPQPTLLMIHRAVAPYVAGAIARGEYGLFEALEGAAREIAGQQGAPTGEVVATTQVVGVDAERFANLNTPEELAGAEARLELLDRT